MSTRNGVPILGQSVTSVHPQQRQTARDNVGSAIAAARDLDLRHGRILLLTDIYQTSVEYLLHLDALREAGCRVLSICEMPVPGPGGQASLRISVLFELPGSLFSAETSDAYNYFKPRS